MKKFFLPVIVLAVFFVFFGCQKSSPSGPAAAPTNTATPVTTAELHATQTQAVLATQTQAVIQTIIASSIPTPVATSTPASSYNVSGTLTLPASAAGKPWIIAFSTDNMFGSSSVTANGICGSGTTVNYQVNIPAGTYYMVAAVGVVSDLQNGPETGDYIGVFGGTWPAYWPSSANVTVPASGQITKNITLVPGNANVSGTLTLPQAEPGKQYLVCAITSFSSGNGPQGFVGYGLGTCSSATSVSYSFLCFRPGPAYVISIVDVAGTGALNVFNSQLPAADFVGAYGGFTSGGNPASTANVSINGTTGIDMTLSTTNGGGTSNCTGSAVQNSEPDNSASDVDTYSRIITAGSLPIVNAISPSNDQDWMKFTLTSTKNVNITITGTGSGDRLVLCLYNQGNYAGGSSFGCDGYNGDKSAPSYSDSLGAGTYYIQVSSYQNSSEVCNYGIQLTTN